MGSLTEEERLEKLPILSCQFPIAPTPGLESHEQSSVRIVGSAINDLGNHDTNIAYLLCQTAWAILLRTYTGEDCVAFVVSYGELKDDGFQHQDQRAFTNTAPNVEYCQYEIVPDCRIKDVQPSLRQGTINISRLENYSNTAVNLMPSSVECSENAAAFGPGPEHDGLFVRASSAVLNQFARL